MRGSKMQHTIRMEQFQIAFVHALAAVNGWRVSSIFPDYDGLIFQSAGHAMLITGLCRFLRIRLSMCN